MNSNYFIARDLVCSFNNHCFLTLCSTFTWEEVDQYTNTGTVFCDTPVLHNNVLTNNLTVPIFNKFMFTSVTVLSSN